MFLILFKIFVAIFEVVQLLSRIIVISLESLVKLVKSPSRKCVNNKLILITGAGRGLGKQLAMKFSELGAVLILWDINKENCDLTADEIRANGGKAFSYEVDVSDYTQVQLAFEQVTNNVGRVYMLINNAGQLHCTPITSLTPQQIRKTLEVNLMAHFWTIKQVLPNFSDGHRHIVAISSNLGLYGSAYLTDYSSSKFGVNGLMSSLKHELRFMRRNDKIILTTVCTGAINTGLSKAIDCRFPKLFPILSIESAADGIVDGILKNESLIVMPAGYRYLYFLLRNIPDKMGERILDFIGTTLETIG